MRTLTLALTSLTLVALGSGCVAKATYGALEKAYRVQRGHAQSIQTTNDRLQAQNEGLLLQKDALEALVQKREAEMQMLQGELLRKDKRWGRVLEQQRKTWDSKLQRQMADLANRDGSGMKFDAEKNKLTLEAGVFFKSGSAGVLPAARRTILQVCNALKDTNASVHIVGHTDNVPLKRAKKLFPRGNWQLSSERALSVLLLMANEGSINGGRLSFEGRGKTVPVDDNRTASGRAKNRRVEIYLRED